MQNSIKISVGVKSGLKVDKLWTSNENLMRKSGKLFSQTLAILKTKS
jgi:hypothetical protein